MTYTPIIDQIIAQLQRLNSSQQQEVLKYTLKFPLPVGTSSETLLKFAGAIAPDQLDQMEKAIEDCEQVDLNEW
jgi:hypothetical protein